MMIKSNFLVCLVILLGMHASVLSQNGTVRGIIYDEVLEPAMGASIIINDSDFFAVSDFNGVFIIPNIPFGDYELEVSYIGYAQQKISISVDNKNVDLVKVFLKSESTQ